MASLSAGLRRRVMLSRAFARPTAIVVLDEPDENLDTETRAVLKRIVVELAAGGMVALATHDTTLLPEKATLVRLDERSS
jgi:ABC-type transport system involved in cytochrome bd biosynthesis fused ATPase/permease subunit